MSRGVGERAGRSGMTLIEVLLAAVILGAGMTVLLTAASRQYQDAQFILSRGEADFPAVIRDGVEDLEVDDERYPGGFVFSRTVDDDEDEDHLWALRTRVTWSDRGRRPYHEVVRYVYYDDGT
jgi:prepilin-type N-terminal cleavage/methylation domain-containing protein